MLSEQHGNLLQADVEAIVNTVNTVGVMGKGIALQFKRAYPENFLAYERACKAKQVELGKMFVVPTNSMANPRFVINFPTKGHWRSRSRLADIESGLSDLVAVIGELGIRSIAVPPLGCGNGGLRWSEVRPLIVAAAEQIPQVEVYVYPPEGSPSPDTMINRSKRPAMTERRAALVLAFERYTGMSLAAGHIIDGEISLVEAQKVAYFLQLAGWRSGFEFVPSHYGPYAQTIDQWLSAVEGHFMSGYGDGSSGSKAVLRILPEALDEARETMAANEEFRAVLDRFETIVRGFETPYGIELLSTVHFILAEDVPGRSRLDEIVPRIEAWSARKAQLFRPRQAGVALDHLLAVGATNRT